MRCILSIASNSADIYNTSRANMQ